MQKIKFDLLLFNNQLRATDSLIQNISGLTNYQYTPSNTKLPISSLLEDSRQIRNKIAIKEKALEDLNGEILNIIAPFDAKVSPSNKMSYKMIIAKAMILPIILALVLMMILKKKN